MEQINFSVITTARGRLDIFPEICHEIWRLAGKPEEIEHIVMYDHDDWEMERFLADYVKRGTIKAFQNKFQVKSLPKINARAYGVIFNGEKNLHRDYWNIAAKLAKGKVVFGLCNDTKLLTPNYDQTILNSIKGFKDKYKHDICQILIDDDSNNHVEGPPNEFCSWVILTKSAVDVIGGIVPDEIFAANGDVAVYNIFKTLDHPAQIDLRKQIKTEHISHYTGRRDFDKVSTLILINSNYPTEEEINSYKTKLNQAIENQICQSNSQS